MRTVDAYWPRLGKAGDSARDGATWPCGHPKTEANTQRVGKAGERCRLCRRKITRDWLRAKMAKK
jgi:hypothetical protein